MDSVIYVGICISSICFTIEYVTDYPASKFPGRGKLSGDENGLSIARKLWYCNELLDPEGSGELCQSYIFFVAGFGICCLSGPAYQTILSRLGPDLEPKIIFQRVYYVILKYLLPEKQQELARSADLNGRVSVSLSGGQSS